MIGAFGWEVMTPQKCHQSYAGWECTDMGVHGIGGREGDGAHTSLSQGLPQVPA